MAKPVLCEETECTGCEACKSICPEACIRMVEDGEGFLAPIIDYARCTECKKCESTCPILRRPSLSREDEPEVFACWHKIPEVRFVSSSGGAFSALAEMVLAEKGVVFGAAYGEGLHVHHTHIEQIEDLDKLRRSKYVQSEIGDSFEDVKIFLAAGRKVLFVGAPCQIAGLHAFLGGEHPGLLTVDFICHGVPSPKVFSRYVGYIEKIFDEKVADIDFRDKRNGWLNNVVVGKFSHARQVQIKGNRNSFFNGFILNAFLRNTCYQCPVIGLPRFGHLTIADFWGIQPDNDIPRSEIDKGISLLMVNGPTKAETFLPALENRLVLFQRTLSEARTGNAPMCIPANRPKTRDEFFYDFDKLTYPDLAKKFLQPTMKRMLIQWIKENFNADFISKARDLKKVVQRIR